MKLRKLTERRGRREAYREYLRGDHWKGLRLRAILRDGKKCVRCGAGGSGLEVHHLRYRYPWESGVLDDVETLCSKCHARSHGLRVEPWRKYREDERWNRTMWWVCRIRNALIGDCLPLTGREIRFLV